MLTLALLPLVAGEIHVMEGEDLYAVLQAAVAGDEIIVHAGTYPTGRRWGLNFEGTQEAPIVVRSQEGDKVVIVGIESQNIIDIGGSYFTWRGFEMRGGSHGIRVETSAHAVFEDLHIHEVGDVGISCNRPDMTYEDITIRGLHIEQTGVGGGPGECMYLGCNDDACQVWDSLIEFNWCHDTTAGSQGDGIELKTGSYNNVIRHNVIHDVKYPGITLYGTVGGRAANLVEGNVIWNVEDNGIQTVGDVIVRNNIVFNAGANALHIKPSQGEVTAGVLVVHNTLYNPGGTCLRANDWPAENGNLVANNALYCEGGTAIRFASKLGDGRFVGNAVVGAAEIDEGYFMGQGDQDFVDAAGKQVFPVSGSVLRGGGATAGATEVDFNCLSRTGETPTVGAYRGADEANPGWVIAAGFKRCEVGDDDDSDTEESDTTDASETTEDDEGAATSTSTTTTTTTTDSGSNSDLSSEATGGDLTGEDEVGVDEANGTQDCGCRGVGTGLRGVLRQILWL